MHEYFLEQITLNVILQHLHNGSSRHHQLNGDHLEEKNEEKIPLKLKEFHIISLIKLHLHLQQKT